MNNCIERKNNEKSLKKEIYMKQLQLEAENNLLKEKLLQKDKEIKKIKVNLKKKHLKELELLKEKENNKQNKLQNRIDFLQEDLNNFEILTSEQDDLIEKLKLSLKNFV